MWRHAHTSPWPHGHPLGRMDITVHPVYATWRRTCLALRCWYTFSRRGNNEPLCILRVDCRVPMMDPSLHLRYPFETSRSSQTAFVTPYDEFYEIYGFRESASDDDDGLSGGNGYLILPDLNNWHLWLEGINEVAFVAPLGCLPLVEAHGLVEAVEPRHVAHFQFPCGKTSSLVVMSPSWDAACRLAALFRQQTYGPFDKVIIQFGSLDSECKQEGQGFMFTSSSWVQFRAAARRKAFRR